jgi:small subunit ribosomal protein S21
MQIYGISFDLPFFYLLLQPIAKGGVCNYMIIVPVKEGENIERALKKFKRKFEKTGIVRELRSRQAFSKPSVIKREQRKKAAYKQHLQDNED